MADQNKRQPVPTGGAPVSAAIENADATTPMAPPEPKGDDQATDAGELVEARVLIAHDDHEPNDVIRATPVEIERLKLAGVVDDHEDAVAFARAA